MTKAMIANGEYRYEFKVNGITRPDIVEAWQVKEKPPFPNILGYDEHCWKARNANGAEMQFNHHELEVIAHKQVK